MQSHLLPHHGPSEQVEEGKGNIRYLLPRWTVEPWSLQASQLPLGCPSPSPESPLSYPPSGILEHGSQRSRSLSSSWSYFMPTLLIALRVLEGLSTGVGWGRPASGSLEQMYASNLPLLSALLHQEALASHLFNLPEK